jgi:hypothetical protein
MSSTRYHDPIALQQLPDVDAAVTSAASLAELVAFCRQQRLKPAVYTGIYITLARNACIGAAQHNAYQEASPMFYQHAHCTCSIASGFASSIVHSCVEQQSRQHPLLSAQ